MIKLIHSFDIDKLLCSKPSDNVRYLIAFPGILNKYSAIIKEKGIEELRINKISDEESLLLEREYINNISDLSARFHSIEWWAHPVSEKNEHLSDLYKNLCLFYTLIKTLKRHIETDKVIHVICSPELFAQLRYYCDQNDIEISSLENPLTIRVRNAARIVTGLLSVCFLLVKSAIKITLTRYALREKISEELKNSRRYYVIRTWIDNRFLKNAPDFRDAYFGSLPEYVKEHGHNLLILARIAGNYRHLLNAVKGAGNYLIIPEEFFLRYSDLFHLFPSAFKRFRIKERILFNRLDVTVLYEREMIKGYYTPEFFNNILRYHLARRFASYVNFTHYIQTFENYSWEKSILMGLKEAGTDGRLLGFQHAFISRNSFKYFPGGKEQGIMPLPDTIITIGKKTRDIMQEYGNYGPDAFRIGCALRQEYLRDLVPFKRGYFKRILIPLTMVRDESLALMNLLYDSGLPGSEIEIVIRCHPAAPFESFSEGIDFDIPKNFIIRNEKSVIDELSDTDMLLYTWSTVAVEALKMGRPVIYLDLLRPMYVDPLFECTALKKSVRDPEELLPAIESFYEMHDELFYKERSKAQEYLDEYFYPVNDRTLSAFLN